MKMLLRWLGAASLMVWFAAAAEVLKPPGIALAGYDLDTLAYTSAVIVEGTLVGTDPVGKAQTPGYNIEVTAVHKGDVKVGEILPVVGLDVYRKDSGKAAFVPLDFGERLALFLNKGPSILAPAEVIMKEGKLRPLEPEAADGYLPAPAGVRLVQEDRVMTFELPNRDPTHRANSEIRQAKGGQTLAEFRDRLSKSMTKTGEVAQHLRAEPASQELPWLLKFLDERRHEHQPGKMDYLAALALERVIKVRDPAALDDFVLLHLPREWVSSLHEIFANPKGRAHLLGKLTDEKVPWQKKSLYASFLGDVINPERERGAGGLFSSASIGATESLAMLGTLARVARENQNKNLFTLILIFDTGYAALQARGSETGLPAEGRAALAPVREMYGSTPSDSEKYEIELMMAKISRAEYDQLGSKCGPVISRLHTIHALNAAASPPRSKLFYFCNLKKLEPIELEDVRMVLESLQTHATWSLPLNDPVAVKDRVLDGHGTSVDLPADFVHGKYRGHLEFLKDGKVISVGHGFEEEL